MASGSRAAGLSIFDVEARLEADRPDRILILPWNLRDEIARQVAGVLPADGRFVTAVPELREFR